MDKIATGLIKLTKKRKRLDCRKLIIQENSPASISYFFQTPIDITDTQFLVSVSPDHKPVLEKALLTGKILQHTNFQILLSSPHKLLSKLNQHLPSPVYEGKYIREFRNPSTFPKRVWLKGDLYDSFTDWYYDSGRHQRKINLIFDDKPVCPKGRKHIE